MEFTINSTKHLKILDKIIDVYFNSSKSYEEDNELRKFINLFEIDIDELAYFIDKGENSYGEKDINDILDEVRRKMYLNNNKEILNTFINDIEANKPLVLTIKNIVAIDFLRQRFYSKINSLEFQLAVRYLSNELSSYLYDVDNSTENSLVEFAEQLDYEKLFEDDLQDTIENKERKNKQHISQKPTYKEYYNLYKGYIFTINENKYIRINSLDEFSKLNECYIIYDNTITKYSINPFEEIDSYFCYDDDCPKLKLKKPAKLKSEEESMIDFKNKNFNYLTSILVPILEKKDKDNYKDFLIYFIYNVILEYYSNKVSNNSIYIFTGYIVAELDIFDKLPDNDSSTKELHKFFSNEVTNALKRCKNIYFSKNKNI